jgi:hypothetical protein
VLVVTRAGTEGVSEFIVPSAEPGRGSGTLEAAHRSVSAFEAPVILFQPVVEVAAGPVPHPFAQLGPDRPGVAVVTVGRDPVGSDAGDRPGRAEERACRLHVATLAEQHVHERAGAVDRAIDVAPAPVDLQVRLIDVPAAPSTCWLKIARGGMLPVLRGSCDIADLGPGCEGLPPGSPVFGGGDVITAEIKEVVDLIVGREETLCLAG